MTQQTVGTTTIAAHLVRRMRELDVDRGFGIVGDFALRLFGALHDLGFPIDVTADEQGAAFAADAYARLRGFGLVAVTYGVGGLKVANATAGAWAEFVPMLVVSGAPGIAERRNDPLLHHKVKGFDTQLKVFADLTVAQTVLDNPLTAAAEIDRVITAMIAEQRPGYVEVPRDMVGVEIADVDGDLAPALPRLDETHLAAALADVTQRLQEAGSAVLLAGMMVARRGLADALVAVSEAAGIPVATSSLGRGVFPERHPLALGVYMGAVSAPEVVERVESCEVGLALGVLYSDLTMGGFTAHVDESRLIVCKDAEVTVGVRTYKYVPLWAFLPALAEELRRVGVRFDAPPLVPTPAPAPRAGTSLTVESVIAGVSDALDERHGLLIEPGECMFASVDMRAPAWALSSAYYATMGYAAPAALGAGRADPGRRPVVLAGDGAFLMTALEVAAAAFHGVAPLVLVLDNGGYGTQRPMLDGPFNDIPGLRAEELPKAFGTGRGFCCATEDELAAALAAAVAADELVIIRAVVPRATPSAALTRLTEALRRRV